MIPDYYDFCNMHECEEMKYEKWLADQPICAECGEHIQTDMRYLIGGEYYCEDCVSKSAELVEGWE